MKHLETNINEYLNLFQNKPQTISELSKEIEIKVYKNNISKLFSFVGDGIWDVKFISHKDKHDKYKNEITVKFHSDSGISSSVWDKVRMILDKLKGEGGFEDYNINQGIDSIVLIFNSDFPMIEH
jgi:hypothetical protein